MNIIYISVLILAAFVAIWFLFVVPAEKRHHERKLEMLEKKIAERNASSNDGQTTDSPLGSDSEPSS